MVLLFTWCWRRLPSTTRPPKRTLSQAGWLIELEVWKDHFEYPLMLQYFPDALKNIKEDVYKFADNYFKLENMWEVNINEAELTLRIDIDGVPFVGTMDRVDNYRDGLRIVDYKTGPYKDVYDWRLSARRQILMYALAYEHEHGVTPTTGVIYWLGGDKPIAEEVEISHNKLQRIKIILMSTYIKACRDIGIPNTGPLCGWCPYVMECPEGHAVAQKRLLDGHSLSPMVHSMLTKELSGELDQAIDDDNIV